MTKQFYIEAILKHTHSFRLSGDCRTAVCNWCDERSQNTTQENASHTKDCPYQKALTEKKQNETRSL